MSSTSDTEKCVIKDVFPQYVSYGLIGVNLLILIVVSAYTMVQIRTDERFQKANCCNKILKYQKKIKKFQN